MKLSSLIAALGATTAIAAGTATAGGYVPPIAESPVVVAPVVEMATPWEGGYVGASLGYVFGADDEIGLTSSVGGVVDARNKDLGSADIKGAALGVHGGYRWQRQNWVFGPELTIEGGSIDGSEDVTFVSNGTTQSAEFQNEINYLSTLVMKTGYVVRPDTLVYGTFGVAYGDFDVSVDGYDSDSYTKTGVAAGLGVERKMNPQLSVFAEYQYRYFEKEEVSFDDGASTLTTEATPKHSIVKVGVNYAF